MTRKASMKAVIFDFDGTLADSLILGLAGVNQLAERFSYPIFEDPDYIRAKGVKQLIKEDLGLRWYQFPVYLRALKKQLMPQLSKLELNEGIEEMIRALHARARLFILTSNIRPAVEFIIERYQLDLFEGVYAGTSLFRKHQKLKRLLRRHQLEAHEAVYVGDEVRDIVACRRIGMPIISVTWGFNSAEFLARAGPNHLAHSPAELLEILETYYL
jgi:phosphoglycolate phosphatase-like HAD superfamily hydrolase